MNIFKELNHKDNLGFYRFDISIDNDIVIIKYNALPNAWKNKVVPDDKKHIVQMNVKNIPAIISAFYSVFQSPLGDSLAIEENDDSIRISMPFNDDRGCFRAISVWNNTNRIEFEFEKPIHINDPLPRIPTLYMVWFTDTLKQIHDEWEKQQGGGQGAQT